MQLKNLSVSTKIWLLLLCSMTLLIATGLGLTLLNQRAQARMVQTLESYEDRVRAVDAWNTHLMVGSSYFFTSNIANAPQVQQHFDTQFQERVKQIAQLVQELEATATPEEKKHYQASLTVRQELLDTLGRIRQARASGADVEGMLHHEMMPVIARYTQILQALIGHLQSERLAAQERAQAEDQLRTLVGLAIFAAVVLLALWSTRWLIRRLRTPLRAAVTLAERIAAGDLSHDLHDDRKDELGQLLQGLGRMNARLRHLVQEVRQSVDGVSEAAGQIAAGNQHLSTRTESTAAHLEETASSLESLTDTVRQSADTTRQANQLALAAAQAAQQGDAVVRQVVQSMERIDASSRRITDIISVIDGIAFQTNILALNAAVEAARAGAQGRGFAVVASEVRSLAGRSAEAAKEIKTLIEASTREVDAGTHQVAEAGERMHDILHSVHRVTDLIGELSAAGAEQSEGLSQVNQAVSHLDRMTQQNAALVEESTTAAGALHAQMQHLAALVAQFHLGQAQGQVPAPLPIVTLPPASAPVALPATPPARALPTPALH